MFRELFTVSHVITVDGDLSVLSGDLWFVPGNVFCLKAHARHLEESL